MVRLDQEQVADLNLDKLFVRTSEGIQIPVGEVDVYKRQVFGLRIFTQLK